MYRGTLPETLNRLAGIDRRTEREPEENKLYPNDAPPSYDELFSKKT